MIRDQERELERAEAREKRRARGSDVPDSQRTSPSSPFPEYADSSTFSSPSHYSRPSSLPMGHFQDGSHVTLQTPYSSSSHREMNEEGLEEAQSSAFSQLDALASLSPRNMSYAHQLEMALRLSMETDADDTTIIHEA